MNTLPFGRLTGRQLLHVEGADALTLLQGQLSTDLRRLDASHSSYTSLNNPKGRLLATGFIHAPTPGHYVLDLPTAIAPSVAQRLKMFVLRSQVRLQLLAPGEGLRGLIDPAALTRLPDSPFAARNTPEGHCARRPGPQPRLVLIGDEAQLPDTALDLSEAWRAADLDAGVVNLRPETQDRFVAPTAGVELLDGIHYDKGCYTGQEVITRLHFLGQSKRHLYRGHTLTAATPGAPLLTADGATAGEIVDGCATAEGWSFLAVLQQSHASSALQLGDSPVLGLTRVERPGGVTPPEAGA